MWQRIQTLFLMLAIGINISLFFLNLAHVGVMGTTYTFDLYGLNDVETADKLSSTIILALATTVSMLLSLVSIFLFKKRQLQIKIAQLNLFLQLVLVVLLFFVVDNVLSTLYPNSEVVLEYGVGTFVSCAPLIFIYLAIKSIKKDEALVRAADRIR